MLSSVLNLIFFCFLGSSTAYAQSPTPALTLEEYCIEWMERIPHPETETAQLRKELCQKAVQDVQCRSVEGRPIFHIDHLSTNEKKKNILVFGAIHGDERESASLARDWILRVIDLGKVRNSWRVIPILNPDGYLKNTRMNAAGIDLNRNFPTSDWDKNAVEYWKKKAKANPRRFPGKSAASEPETKCAMHHIEVFEPDLIIAVHTPYHVIDMDGPKQIRFPRFHPIPFQRLGHFPGSLGRYMWGDRQIPVVTIELNDGKRKLTPDEEKQLQDILGDLAYRVSSSPPK